MHISVEGLPALGKSEVLSILRLYYPDQVVVLPELVKEAAEQEGIDLFRKRARLSEAIWAHLPERERAIRDALSAGRTVIEESHLAVHAAYAAAMGDTAFLAQFREREPNIVWPNRFLRLVAPIAVSRARQGARADPRYAVSEEILTRMLPWLDAWHARQGSDLWLVEADRPPGEVLEDVASAAGLTYRGQTPAEVLPYLFLLGRPAAGKSELIQFLRHLSPDERAAVYHLGRLRVADDFPLLWELFVADDLWEKAGRGRLHSRRAGENYAVVDDGVWPFLILKLQEELARHPVAPGETVIVEFARGGPTAYRDALHLWSPTFLQKAALLYLDVTFAESWRRNIARYDRDRRAGILTHSVPREEMERTYARDDWATLVPHGQGYLPLGGIRVPYETVPNTPEPTSADAFAHRFQPALATLWELHRNR
ncbi:MAG: hypothetical protein PHZ21_00775 [Candidatus Bipolaricaulis sp.]|nr:hypothetical protein [Candidatus Bipolaricaulis sp.]